MPRERGNNIIVEGILLTLPSITGPSPEIFQALIGGWRGQVEVSLKHYPYHYIADRSVTRGDVDRYLGYPSHHNIPMVCRFIVQGL